MPSYLPLVFEPWHCVLGIRSGSPVPIKQSSKTDFHGFPYCAFFAPGYSSASYNLQS